MSDVRAVDVRGLVAYYGDHPVNRPLTFALRAGQVGLLRGANGSGKTSVMRSLLGEVAATAELLTVCGMRPVVGQAWKLTRRAVRLVPQAPCPVPDMSMEAYLSAWSRYSTDHGDRRQQVGRVLHHIADVMGVAPGVPVGHLSFGQRRFVDAWLAVEAAQRLILADEPFAGLADTLAAEVSRRLRQFVQEGGSVLSSVHETDNRFWATDWVAEVIQH